MKPEELRPHQVEALKSDDPVCPNCRIPLRAIINVSEGRCVDQEACNKRLELLTLTGYAHLISPDGVTRIDLTEEE